MRNKILAAFWMTIGAFTALWLGAFPLSIVQGVLLHFVGRHSPVLVIPALMYTLPAMAYGATWFQKLFYQGILWGYRPEKDS